MPSNILLQEDNINALPAGQENGAASSAAHSGSILGRLFCQSHARPKTTNRSLGCAVGFLEVAVTMFEEETL